MVFAKSLVESPTAFFFSNTIPLWHMGRVFRLSPRFHIPLFVRPLATRALLVGPKSNRIHNLRIGHEAFSSFSFWSSEG